MRSCFCKRFIVFLFVILLTAALTGCSSKAEDSYTVTLSDGSLLHIDPKAQTILSDSKTYFYTVSGSGEHISYHITYPNGASYYRSKDGISSHEGWSNNYTENGYIRGDLLIDALASHTPTNRSGRNVLIGLLLIAVGAFPAIWPQKAWFLDFGWRFQNAEPSEAALFFHRAGGILVIIIGIVMFFV